MQFHGLAVVYAYQYLFDDHFGRYRNPYDPEFRGACDLYNEALESAIRIIKRQGKLVPGSTQTIEAADQQVEVTIVLRSQTWRAEDFAEFRFVSDYDIRGLRNQYHNYGLGVPLIADPQASRKRQPRGKVLSAGHELSGHRLSCASCRTAIRATDNTSCTWSCTTRSTRRKSTWAVAACRWNAT